MLKSSYVGCHNHSIFIGYRSDRVPVFFCFSRANLFNRVLPKDLGLLGTLIRASLDLGSAMYPCTTLTHPGSNLLPGTSNTLGLCLMKSAYRTVAFLELLGGLVLSAPQGVIPELLATC